MLWPKKNFYKEFANEKKFLRLENFPSPPHNFSNGPSLRSLRNDEGDDNENGKQQTLSTEDSTFFFLYIKFPCQNFVFYVGCKRWKTIFLLSL